jgi:RNA-directed DNA polymerase
MDAAPTALHPVAAMETAARATRLMRRGLAEERAWASANNGRGPWWNAGASHMNDAFRAAFFANLGLPSLLMEHQRLNRAS